MTTARKTPRTRPATLAKRREILAAALEVFGAKGYTNGTLGDIADQVGITHAGVLHHFGSKDQLLLDVLEFRDESDLTDLEGHHMPGGRELFRHLVHTAFVNAHRAGIVQAYAVLSAESVTDAHPARSYFESRYRTLRADIVDAFERVCDSDGIDAPDTIAAASAAILAVMDGLQVQWLLDPERVDLGAASGFAIEAIVSSVLGEPVDLGVGGTEEAT